MRSHPDKMVLAENQTKEEADSHFVELTKAYKACVPVESFSDMNTDLSWHIV